MLLQAPKAPDGSTDHETGEFDRDYKEEEEVCVHI